MCMVEQNGDSSCQKLLVASEPEKNEIFLLNKVNIGMISFHSFWVLKQIVARFNVFATPTSKGTKRQSNKNAVTTLAAA